MSKNGGMSRDKSRKRHITNFYMETLVLAVVLIAVILVLTRMYAFSGQLSRRAEVLTRAVHLAENAAEAVAASDGMDTLRSLLEVNGNVEISGEGAILQARCGKYRQRVLDGRGGAGLCAGDGCLSGRRGILGILGINCGSV